MSKYSVDPTVVRPVLTNAQGAIAKYGTSKALETALGDAVSALPSEYAEVKAALTTVKSEHVRDYQALLEFASSSVEAVIACMNIYDTASADMVAQQREIHQQIDFESPWGGGNLQDWLSSKGDRSSESQSGRGFSMEGSRERNTPLSPSQESGSRSTESWNSNGSTGSGSSWSTNSDDGTATATSEKWNSSSDGTSSYGGATVKTGPDKVSIVAVGAATDGNSAALVAVGAAGSVTRAAR